MPARLAGATLCLVALGPAMPAVAPAQASPAPAAAQRPGGTLPAPPQMTALDFLLGSFRCTDTPSPGATPTTLYLTTRKVLGGHYYDTEVSIRPGVLRGRGTLGWNPVDQNYFSQYVDDWGSASTSVSPGWQDGHLVLTGNLMQVLAPSATGQAPGGRATLADDYTIVGPGHFRETQTITLPNGLTFAHNYDCRRR